MSQLINIVGNVKAALTSTKVFTPVTNNQSGKLVEFEDNDANVVKSLRQRASYSLRPGNTTTRRKVVTKLAVPFQPAAVNGVLPPIMYQERIITDLVPEVATGTETIAMNLLTAQAAQDPMYIDLLANGRFPY